MLRFYCVKNLALFVECCNAFGHFKSHAFTANFDGGFMFKREHVATVLKYIWGLICLYSAGKLDATRMTPNYLIEYGVCGHADGTTTFSHRSS